MTRKWSARLLALGGLTLALGCRSTPAAPVVTTPLLPGPVIIEPTPVGPSPVPAGPALTLAPVPTAPLVSASRPTTGPDLILPPGAVLPQPEELPPTQLPVPRLVQAPAEPRPLPPGPDLPPVLPPRDVAGLLASHPKPAEVARPAELPSPKPIVKPLLIDPPRPPAGEDGFAPAPRVPAAPPGPVVGPLPVIRSGPIESAIPLKPGEKYGHAPDYRWVAGVLDRHAKDGYWTIRYADFGTDDEWGGKVRLMDDPRLREFRNGDVVYVEGELMRSAGGPAYPPYRVSEVKRVEQK
jgi:hypothetical protein